MKKFKPMNCPICGEVYFSEPLEDFKEEEMAMYNNGEAYCQHCGWVYDLDQAENPTLKEGFNKLSLNEYKEWYANKLKENPNYDYFEEHRPSPIPHKCPVCGEYEFEDENSHDICSICGWEDEDCYDGGGANTLSLEDAIRLFKAKRSQNPKYKWIKDKK